ncbi:histone acetylation protein-domain-containing protein [Delphinella strobiligena]|nr:histone acetylation protein-domain-containing protein [Delphinella strobiligena]
MAIAGGVCCHLEVCVSCDVLEEVEKDGCCCCCCCGDESCLGWRRVWRATGRIHLCMHPTSDEAEAGSKYTFYHVSTPPTKSDPLFAPPPGQKQQRTYCESHFLTVSIDPPGRADAEHVIVYAIEVLIYTTKTLTTLFVSKADSTGYLSLQSSPPSNTPSPIRTITSTFVSWLVEHRQRPGVSCVVSLFARAQDQYLFPGSVENKGKHVLDDRQLVRWWCKTLDPVLRKESDSSAQAYLIVPGFDKYETSAFFPPSSKSDPPAAPKWHYGHPLRDIAPDPTAPPRCLVPHFPDDPKARYLDELDDEIPNLQTSQTLFSPSKRGRGVWTSIKTLDQFWETMTFRQECSSGRLVGFLWLLFTPSDPFNQSQRDSFHSQTPLSPLATASQDTQDMPSVPPPRRKKLTGPIISRLPKIKSSPSNASVRTQPHESPYYSWSFQGRAQLVVDHASYLRVHDLLLRLDFANQDAAVQSTRKWVDEVGVIADTTKSWAMPVVGLLAETNNLAGMTVRKKRKPDTSAVLASQHVQAAIPAVNLLGSGLVRKKPKV